MCSVPERKHSGLGGLKRLGTVIGRRRQSSKTERAPSPDKEKRSRLNPLRRGESSRDLQPIPSDTSLSNIRTSTPHQEHGALPETPRSPMEQRRRDDYVNGDTIEPAPIRYPETAPSNGVHQQRNLAQYYETNPASPQSKPVEVSADGF